MLFHLLFNKLGIDVHDNLVLDRGTRLLVMSYFSSLFWVLTILFILPLLLDNNFCLLIIRVETDFFFVLRPCL